MADTRAPLRVLKFGGTSVEDAGAFQRVVEIVRAHGGARCVVVVSAMSGVMDALLTCVSDGSLTGLEPHLERHRQVARLVSGAAGEGLIAELERARPAIAGLLERAGREHGARAGLRDEVVSYGERLSSSLLAAVLAAAGLPARHVDARRCIVTDDTHGRAAPDRPESERCTRAELVPLLERGAIPVLGGYIAASRSGATTTLGRGGSDYTAALVGAALGADEIQIWTDVPGVMTADPRVVPHARAIPNLSYAEASELAYFGAKVLHPKTIEPAVGRRLPVRIVSSRAPDEPGTLVSAEAELWPGRVKAIAHKTGITMLQITAARMLGAYGFLRALFQVFERHRHAVPLEHLEQRAQEAVGAEHPRRGDLEHGDPRLVRDRLDPARPQLGLGGDEGAGLVRSPGAHDPHGEAAADRRLDGLGVKHLRAEIRQLRCFGIRQVGDGARVRHDAGIGGHHSGHVRPDLDLVRAEGGADERGGDRKSTRRTRPPRPGGRRVRRAPGRRARAARRWPGAPARARR